MTPWQQFRYRHPGCSYSSGGGSQATKKSAFLVGQVGQVGPCYWALDKWDLWDKCAPWDWETGTMGHCHWFLWSFRFCDGELFSSKTQRWTNAKIHRFRTQNACDMPLSSVIAASPERARYTSPGQRPGLWIATPEQSPERAWHRNPGQRPDRCRLRWEVHPTLNATMSRPYRAWGCWGEGTSAPGWRTPLVCLPWAGISCPVGASVRNQKWSCLSWHENFFSMQFTNMVNWTNFSTLWQSNN